MTMKGFNRVVFEDLIQNPELKDAHPKLRSISDLSFKTHYGEVDAYAQTLWNQKIVPGIMLGQNLGNLYTGSIFACLVSLLCNEQAPLLGKRILMFAYGSGLASSMFTMTVRPEAASFLTRLRQNNPLQQWLNSRIKLSPEEYSLRMDRREVNYNRCSYAPTGTLDELDSDVHYLVKVDDKWRRTYAKKTSPRL